MRAFITGIAGFAGRHLADHLRACGDEVWGSTQEPTDDTLAWDLAGGNSREIERALASFRPDVIYHLAAISKAEDCGRAAPTPEALAVNVEGTRAVLTAAAALRARVVLISSSYVYPARDGLAPHAEDPLPPVPATGYGQTKWRAEALLREFAAVTGQWGVVARAFQHTGPGQIPRFMLPEWCAQLAAGGDGPLVIRNSEAWVDLSDVRDVVRAYRLLAERGARGEAYNVGSGQPRRSGDIAAQLLQLAGSSRPVAALAHDTRHGPIADLRKIGQATGWQPEIPFAQTMRDTLASFQAAASH